MDPKRLIELTQNPAPCRVLVLGDLMLDRYVWGEVSRVSQEAPIPVLKVTDEAEMPGGAGIVAMNLRTFGAETVSCGAVGDDAIGRALRAALEDQGVRTDGIVTDPGRPTTRKTRFLGSVQSAARAVQHVLRVDRETVADLPEDVASALLERVEANLAECQAVLVSDYAKGLLSPALLGRVMAGAARAGIPVLVDPRLGNDYALYKGATAVTPNRFETEQATGIAPRDEAGMDRAAAALIASLGLDFAVITVDRDGLYLRQKDGAAMLIPARSRSVYDVSGAGDMVLSALGFFLAAGADPSEAALLANIAAGVEVGKLGVSSVSLVEIRDELKKTQPMAADKFKERDALVRVLEHHRRRRETIVFTNGCFDILHAGHMNYLQTAREQGDLLVVGLNSDASVKRLKGPTRPILAQNERARGLAALPCVDYVVVFEEDTPAEIIAAVQPDVLVKGNDWAEKGVVGREFVESRGGKVVLADLVGGFSTSTIIERVLQRHGAGESS